MTPIFTLEYKGISGKKYRFDFYDLKSDWYEIAGVYLIASYNPVQKTVTPIYVGETDNLRERITDHPKQICFTLHNASVLGWIWEKNPKTRLDIEADLIASLKPPCND